MQTYTHARKYSKYYPSKLPSEKGNIVTDYNSKFSDTVFCEITLFWWRSQGDSFANTVTKYALIFKTNIKSKSLYSGLNWTQMTITCQLALELPNWVLLSTRCQFYYVSFNHNSSSRGKIWHHYMGLVQCFLVF